MIVIIAHYQMLHEKSTYLYKDKANMAKRERLANVDEEYGVHST